MNKLLGKRRIMIIAAAIIVLLAAGFIYIRNAHMQLLDHTEFEAFASGIDEITAAGGFEDQAALRDYITGWADDHSIEYKKDKSGNIVFNTPAVDRKKNVSPSVVCVSYNYETAADNAKLLASAAMIAAADLKSGRKTVIFCNDVRGEGKGYRSVSKKLLSGKPKVIYMDYGASSYLSRSSFNRVLSEITVPAETSEVTGDAAVRIHIAGIRPGEINTSISRQPDPVNAFSVLLSRLKAKSVVFQLSDLSVTSDGNMYPTGLDATIIINSYSVSSFTKYIDKRIKAWERSYSADHPDLIYSYEVIDDPDLISDSAYSEETSATLANVLYTIQNGAYKYASGDDIPENREEGDLCGINCLYDVQAGEDAVRIAIMTQAVNESYSDRIISDNTAAAELFGCSISIIDSIDRFNNEKDSLSRTIHKTLEKISDSGSSLKDETDNYFTPSSYLQRKNSKADIVHIRLNDRYAASFTNMILYYIATKGNFLAL